MTIPTIHLNGTSKRELLDQLSDVSDALNTAYGALKRAAPNGRDYYPQGAAAMEAALAVLKTFRETGTAIAPQVEASLADAIAAAEGGA